MRNKAKYPLSPAEPTHRKWTIIDEILDFWLTNKPLIGIIIVLCCICILVYMLGVASATGHIHFLSTEANTYEHMEQIVLCYGGGFL